MMNQRISKFKIVFILSFFLTILLCNTKVFAQQNKDSQLYKTWVKVNNIKSKEIGYLYKVKDSSLLITKGFEMSVIPNVEEQFNEVFYTDIDILKIQKNGSVGRGAGKGALIGLAAGVVGGLIAYATQGSEGITLGPGEIIGGMSIMVEPACKIWMYII